MIQIRKEGKRMRRILIVVGSGNINGHTDQLARAFEKGAIQAGHEVKRIVLSKNLQGCQGCGACQINQHHCVIQDSMQEYYAMFEWADTLVLASPLYFWSISGRLKCFIDRLYAISQNDEYPYKETFLLMSAGDNHFWTFEQAVSYYQFALVNYIGFHDRGMILAGGCGDTNGAGRIKETQWLEKAFEFGKNI